MQPIQLGRMTIHKIYEMGSPVPLMDLLPGTTAQDVKRLQQWHHAPDELTGDPATTLMGISIHSYVIEVDGQTILIDSCCGNDKSRPMPDLNLLNGPYLANLAAAGFMPEDIDMVLCTHLHFDHIGWNTRLENGKWVPTFPNARYLFGQKDYDYFASNPVGEEIHLAAFLDSIVPVMDAGQGILVPEDSVAHREIGDGVWLEPAFGHSPGCCIINAQAGGEAALFWGDVAHHPIQLIRHDLKFAFDADGQQACVTRKRVLQRAAEEELLCFPAHFCGSSAGYVRHDRDAFRYEWVKQSD